MNETKPPPLAPQRGVQKIVRDQTQAVVSAIKQRKRLTRRLLLVVAGLAFVHVSVILFVSIPASQTWLIDRVQRVLEREYGVGVEIGYVSVGFFPPRFVLQEVQVALAPSALLASRLPFLERASAAASELAIGVDLFGMLSEPPAPLSSLTMKGGRLVAPDPDTIPQIMRLLRSSEAAPVQDEGDFWASLQTVLARLPARVHLDETAIELGEARALDHLAMGISGFDLIRGRGGEFAVLVALSPSRLQLESLQRPLGLDAFRLEMRLRSDRNVLVDTVRVQAPGLELQTKGLVHLGQDLSRSSAELDVSAELDGSWLDYVGLGAKGTLAADGKLSLIRSAGMRALSSDAARAPAVPSLLERVAFVGQTRWKAFELGSFAVHSGSAAVSLEDATLSAARIAVTSPEGGKVSASGSVRLGGSFPFSATADVDGLPFLELLRGFGVQSRAIDFKIHASRLQVAGEGHAADPSQVFRLDFRGPVEARTLVVPSVHEAAGPLYALPDCLIDLSLRVDTRQLDFDGSRVACDEPEPNITVRTGRVLLDDGATRFDLSAKNLDLSSVSYFARLPVTGNADVTGTIKTVGDGVVFESDIAARDFVFSGFGPGQLRTRLRIGADGLLMTDVRVKPDDPRLNTLALSSQRIFVAFDDTKSAFQVSLRGPLDRLQFLAPQYEPLGGLSGDARNVNMTWEMDLTTAELSAIEGRLQVQNFKWGPLQAKEVEGLLNCKNFLCRSSVVSWRQAAVGQQSGALQAPSAQSYAAIRLRNLSRDGFAMDLETSEVPVVYRGQETSAPGTSVASAGSLSDSDSQPGTGISAAINAAVTLSGPLVSGWPGAVGQVTFDDVSHQGTQLGNLVLELKTAEQKTGRRGPSGAKSRHVEARIHGAFDQIRGQFGFDLDGRSSVRGTLEIDRFDAMSLFVTQRARHNLYSEVSGRVSFETPSFMESGAFAGPDWLSRCSAQASIERLVWAADGSVRAEATEPISAVLRDSQVSLGPVSLRSMHPFSSKRSTEASGQARGRAAITEPSSAQIGSAAVLRQPLTQGDTTSAQQATSLLRGSMSYHLGTRSGQAKLSGRVHLALLQGLTDVIDDVNGTLSLDTTTTITRGVPSLRGSLIVDADSLAIKGFEPEISSLKGRIELDGDRLEVTKLQGNKGQGQFEILGSVQLPLSHPQQELGLGLRARLNRVQTRLAAPIFRTVDVTTSGSLELSGSERPYALTGQLSVERLRAFRDLDCDGIVESMPKGPRERMRSDLQPWLALDVVIEATESVQLLTQCVRTNLSSQLRVLGSELAPRFSGTLSADAGLVQVLKARFAIQRAELVFDTPIAFDPRLDIQLVAQVENYQVFLNIDGYSSAPRSSFWSDPSTTPWGAPIGQAEILRMVATGRAPRSDSAQGNVLASQVANYVYGSTALDESLSKALSRLTAGFVDTVQLQPFIEDGQTAWKATLSRGLGDRFNLGLNVEQSPIANNQSLTGTLYLNQSVNVLGGFDRKSSSLESYYELSGGLRFMFGGK